MPEFKPADPDFIRSVLQHPRVWRWMRCDGVDISQMLPRDGEIYFQIDECGFIMYREVLPDVFEVHTSMIKAPALLPVLIHSSLRVMRSQGARKFIAPIGGWNTPALRLAETCGFTKEGEITDAYRRDGKNYSMILWGSL